MRRFGNIEIYRKALEFGEGNPVYLYSEEVLREMAGRMIKFSKKLSDSGIKNSIHYSTKANANLNLIKIIKSCGLLIDAMSPVELELAKAAGYKSEEIVYVANNITANEMEMVTKKAIVICLDSVSGLEMLGKVCPNSKVIVRINPEAIGIGHSDKVVTVGENTKFGVAIKDIEKAVEVCKKYNLKIVGMHQHLGSHFLDDEIDTYIHGVAAGLEVAKHFEDLEFVDLGGGFGTSYKPEEKDLNLDLVAEKLIPILNKFKKDYGKEVEFKFEPGRIVVADSSMILGNVTSIKSNFIGTNYVGTNIGMGTLVRPSMYGSYHHIDILNEKNINDEKTFKATVVGNICESCDELGKGRDFSKEIAIGDIVAVYSTGAYGYSMSSNYTGRLHTSEVLLTLDGELKLIRKGETIEDYMEMFC